MNAAVVSVETAAHICGRRSPQGCRALCELEGSAVLVALCCQLVARADGRAEEKRQEEESRASLGCASTRPGFGADASQRGHVNRRTKARHHGARHGGGGELFRVLEERDGARDTHGDDSDPPDEHVPKARVERVEGLARTEEPGQVRADGLGHRGESRVQGRERRGDNYQTEERVVVAAQHGANGAWLARPDCGNVRAIQVGRGAGACFDALRYHGSVDAYEAKDGDVGDRDYTPDGEARHHHLLGAQKGAVS
mmetsp:Transcript_6322/g.14571  ORF Transcript_6322/g.14571 Transcript_6322/m.14571 type:complete len:254 (+) Transcript_6322:428-1189(+)